MIPYGREEVKVPVCAMDKRLHSNMASIPKRILRKQ
jgi:hypothetical protein